MPCLRIHPALASSHLRRISQEPAGDMSIDMSIDMFTDIVTDICTDICTDTFIDSIDISTSSSMLVFPDYANLKSHQVVKITPSKVLSNRENGN